MVECDKCGIDSDDVELLGFPASERDSDEDWRLGRLCRECRTRSLMPVLRRMMPDSAWLNDPEGDAPTEPIDDEGVFSTFETERGTRHIAAEVVSGPRHGFDVVCVAECGATSRAEPTAHVRSLEMTSRVCRKCASIKQHLIR